MKDRWSRRRLAQTLGSATLMGSFDLGASAAGRAVSGHEPAQFQHKLQTLIDQTAAMGGGIVEVPPGKHETGPIELKSNVLLNLLPGAVLRCAPDRRLFAERGALVYARNAVNTGVIGRGCLDGNFLAFVTRLPTGGYAPAPTGIGAHDPEPSVDSREKGRPRVIFMIGCRDVVLDGFQCADAATWTIHLLGCEDVIVTSVTIRNDVWVPNTDGIDIDHCRRVRVTNCAITTGDDGICLKTTSLATGMGPCEDIVVHGCHVTSQSSAIKLGTAGSESIRGVVVTDCTINASNRGVAIQNRDGGSWEDVLFSNLVIRTQNFPDEWWGAGEPIHVSNVPRRAGQSAGLVRRISFRDLVCDGEGGVILFADPVASLREITLSDVQLSIRRTTSHRPGRLDLRPSYKYQQVPTRNVAGVYGYGVDDLRMQNVSVEFAKELQSGYGPEFETPLSTVNPRNTA